ncbi:hypothetical protein EV379_1375 [Microterricola gilva]|uniref:Antibiotic biosynthesis monooxygenase n=1 Tax=Microterricola gilva TaxID=393267 RepID=A0A4V2GAP1_9MICO|nr:hypothetical protein [Microterricola gilva]RZU65056.1 hypothetical protein EV379_1375 [Microterricola gilva]
MITLRIEHPISDFDTWKAAFDRDPADRRASGVLHYTICRPLDDPRFVTIDLDFATVAEAEGLLATMTRVWASGVAAPALAGTPYTRILQPVEVVELAP